ncbi:hypothetical protein TrCOL_g7354, partial [Triparma columacea]
MESFGESVVGFNLLTPWSSSANGSRLCWCSMWAIRDSQVSLELGRKVFSDEARVAEARDYNDENDVAPYASTVQKDSLTFRVRGASSGPGGSLVE